MIRTRAETPPAAAVVAPAPPPRTEPVPDLPPPARVRRPASARLRIVGWQLVLVVVALVAAVVLTQQTLVARMDERIDRSLVQEIDELRTLAMTGLDPETGAPFTDARQLMRVELARSVPDRNETMLAFVDGLPDSRSADEPPLRLDIGPGAVAAFTAVTVPTAGNVETSAGTVRYAAMPIEVAGSRERGTFVVAMFRDLERGEIDDVTRVLGGVGLGALALAAAAGWLIAGRVLAPVRLVRSTAQTITDTDLSRRIDVEGNDDVAELASTFNHMLDRLEVAFETQRRFVDDAGHELRTPLTIVRGHLELLPADPRGREETIALITDELDRMTRMVDDLLVLAKTQRPDFLQPGPVDVAAFTDEVLAKLVALAPRRWSVDARADGRVVADKHRLTQAVLQLAANAVQHTRAGDTIALGTAVSDGQLRIWVRDTGPGVAPADRDRIFERFARARDARRRSEGAGLGLAIVRAIARGHDGDIVLDDPPGGGARFSLDLPVSPHAPSPHRRRE